MRVAASPRSHHRLQRIYRWAILWLSGFAAFLEAAAGFAPISRQVEDIAHRWLDNFERIVVSIIVVRAAPHVRPLQKRSGRADARRSHATLFRAIIGSHLRRALRVKDLHRRIGALTQNIDALVARLVRRLPRGLTRRNSIALRPEPRALAPPNAAPTLAPAPCDDTS